MFDSLAYRNDAAIVMRRLIRSLPTASGVMGIATCDKGLPATMLALAGTKELPGRHRARRRHAAGARRRRRRPGAEPRRALLARPDQPRLRRRRWAVARAGRRAAGASSSAPRPRRRSSRKALGLALPHSALAPSGEPVVARAGEPLGRGAAASARAGHPDRPHPHRRARSRTRCSCTPRSAARRTCCCTSRRSPHAAGLQPPTVDDWIRVNRATPRLVDALPNGPRGHPTVQVFMAGGVPEVMLHLRRMGLLHGDVLTATGDTLDATLDWWESSERRRAARARLASAAAIDPDDVIMAPDAARRAGLTEHGRVSASATSRREGSVDQGHRDRSVGRRRRRRLPASRPGARVHRRARGDSRGEGHVQPADARGRRDRADRQRARRAPACRRRRRSPRRSTTCRGANRSRSSPTGGSPGSRPAPASDTSAPRRCDGGPIGRVRDGDLIEIVIDREHADRPRQPGGRRRRAARRRRVPTRCSAAGRAHPALAPHERLPDDTRLWAALQRASGGTWAGCVYDVDRIVAALDAAAAARRSREELP